MYQTRAFSICKKRFRGNILYKIVDKNQYIITNGTMGKTKRFHITEARLILPIKKIIVGRIPIVAHILGER